MANIYQRNIGDVGLTAIQDAWARWAPEEIIRRDVEPDLAPFADLLDADGKMEMSITVYLLESQGTRVLVDTGLADLEMRRRTIQEHSQLLIGLEEVGVDPETIEYVVITHLHFDHVGWCMRREGDAWVPTFPNARYLIQRPEWQFWVVEQAAPPGHDVEHTVRPLERAGLIQLLDGDLDLTPEVTAVSAPGHTPGHQVVRIASGGETAYVLGDSCHVVMQVSEVEWSDWADTDHVLGNQTRAALMERADAEDAIVIGGHFPFPGLGKRVRDEGRLRYQPV